MGEMSGGVMRFGNQTPLITPQRLSRFGIEVDDALRAGGSGFLGESDAGEAYAPQINKNGFGSALQEPKKHSKVRCWRSNGGVSRGSKRIMANL